GGLPRGPTAARSRAETRLGDCARNRLERRRRDDRVRPLPERRVKQQEERRNQERADRESGQDGDDQDDRKRRAEERYTPAHKRRRGGEDRGDAKRRRQDRDVGRFAVVPRNEIDEVDRRDQHSGGQRGSPSSHPAMILEPGLMETTSPRPV